MIIVPKENPKTRELILLGGLAGWVAQLGAHADLQMV